MKIVPASEVSIVSAASRNTIAPVGVRSTRERPGAMVAVLSAMFSIVMDSASNVSVPLPADSSDASVSKSGPAKVIFAPTAPPSARAT